MTLVFNLNQFLIVFLTLNLNPSIITLILLILGVNFLLLLYFSRFKLHPSWLHLIQLLIPSFFSDWRMTNCSSFNGEFLSLFKFAFVGFFQFANPFRYITAWDFEQVSQWSDDWFVFISKKSESGAISLGSSSSTYSVNVRKHGVGEIIVNDKIGVLKVDTSCDEVSGDKGPEFSLIELLDNLLSFLLGFLSSQHFKFFLSSDCGLEYFLELIIKLFGSGFFLNKY